MGVMGSEKVNREGEKVNMSDVLCTIYESRTMKSVEIILRKVEGRRGRMMEGVNLIKIYCKHICKMSQYISSLQLL
jgi:hypothetical protein